MKFYLGMHHPSDARHVELACISYRAIKKRKSDFVPSVGGWILDSGAFRELELHGGYQDEPVAYALGASRWATIGRLDAVVSQDYMCEPFMLARTGLTVACHQRLTIERFRALRAVWEVVGESAPLMPVLQGWTVRDYQNHVHDYGADLKPNAWVGVGSVCKRQGDIALVEDILCSIKEVRPDLRLHGFWREDRGAGEPADPPASPQRRQHGVVVRGSLRRPRRQRLSGSARLRMARQQPARKPNRAVATFCSATPHTSWTERQAVDPGRWRENWTADANAALRFARKADAETLIRYVGWQGATATEHKWLAAAPVAPPIGGEKG